MKYVPLLRDDSILLDSHHSQLTALGLGWTRPDEPSKANWLHQVNLTWIDNDVCANATDGEDSYQGRIDASHICTFEPGKDSCAYDSGSPMIVTTTNKNKKDGLDHYQDYLVAQVSWGMECADEVFPAVNARLSTVLDWIDETVCAWSVDPPADFGCYPTTTVDNNAGPWNFSIPFMGNADFVYIIVACLFAACGSRMYWRRRRHNYEALK
jgi:secreted trypsin-like serine protease